MDADQSVVKKKSNGKRRRVHGKITEIWQLKGKAMDTNTGGSPGYQNQHDSLESHLVRKWGDIGHLRALSPWINGWMDGWLKETLD